jgi:hypothetical protein
MIDLAALATLFFEASKEWTEPKIERLDPPDAAEKEDIVRKLREKRHDLQWVRDTRLRALKREQSDGDGEQYLRALPLPDLDCLRPFELLIFHHGPSSGSASHCDGALARGFGLSLRAARSAVRALQRLEVARVLKRRCCCETAATTLSLASEPQSALVTRVAKARGIVICAASGAVELLPLGFCPVL